MLHIGNLWPYILQQGIDEYKYKGIYGKTKRLKLQMKINTCTRILNNESE